MTKNDLINYVKAQKEVSFLRDISIASIGALPKVYREELLYRLELIHIHEGKFVEMEHIETGSKFYCKNAPDCLRRVKRINPKASVRNIYNVLGGQTGSAYGFKFRYLTSKDVFQ